MSPIHLWVYADIVVVLLDVLPRGFQYSISSEHLVPNYRLVTPTYPTRANDQANKTLLHHTLNTPSTFTTFSTMSEPLSVSQALLSAVPPVTDTTWTEAFDKVLNDVLQQCRPGYVEIPTDAVHHKVSSKGLKTPPVRSSRVKMITC